MTVPDENKRYWRQAAERHGARLAEAGEVCPCGTAAVLMLPGARGEIPWCGSSDDIPHLSTCVVCKEMVRWRHGVWVHNHSARPMSEAPYRHDARILPDDQDRSQLRPSSCS